METLEICSILNAINILLILSLLYVYVKNYKMMRSKFSLGLILFAALFLIRNVTALYFQIMMIEYYSDMLTGIVLMLNVLETLALVSLTYISWR